MKFYCPLQPSEVLQAGIFPGVNPADVGACRCKAAARYEVASGAADNVCIDDVIPFCKGCADLCTATCCSGPEMPLSPPWANVWKKGREDFERQTR